APPHLLFMARCRAKLGKLVEARDLYQRVISEELGKNAPGPFQEAQADARTERAALESRLASVRVTIRGPADARVTIDDAPAAAGERIALDPGQHRIAATAGGSPPVNKTVTLREGAGTEEVELTLGAPAAERASEGSEAPPPPVRGSVVPAIVAFGVGGVG